jgi:hypothetical protein
MGHTAFKRIKLFMLKEKLEKLQKQKEKLENISNTK